MTWIGDDEERRRIRRHLVRPELLSGIHVLLDDHA